MLRLGVGGDEFSSQPVPDEVASAVSATAAESLLMGIFVLICSFELRGVKAGTFIAPNGKPSVSNHISAEFARSLSAPCVPAEGTPLASVNGSSSAGQALAHLSTFPKNSGQSTPKRVRGADDDAGSIYGMDAGGEYVATATAYSAQYDSQAWQIGPLVMMMILLHVIYPSFPISPQVEVGRIFTFLGFLWSVGPGRCINVVNTEPMHKCRLAFIALMGGIVHLGIFVATDTISDLIFPDAGKSIDLYSGPRYLHQLLKYLAIRYPSRSASFGLWAAWILLSAVVFTSAVWKEFLFRGVYLGGLRTSMPFWAANVTAALVYAFAHEPLQVSHTGTIQLCTVGCAPLFIGSLWCGYLYHSCNNLVVTVCAHLLFNAGLVWLHLVAPGLEP